MGVRKKGRRKIICDERPYTWWIAQDNDTPFHILHIVSEDKHLILSCPLDHPGEPYVITQGTTFQGTERSPAVHLRYQLPMPLPEVVTPQFVAALIRWATIGNEPTRTVWNGRSVPV